MGTSTRMIRRRASCSGCRAWVVGQGMRSPRWPTPGRSSSRAGTSCLRSIARRGVRSGLRTSPSSPPLAVACDEDEVLVGLSSGKVAAFRASDQYPLWNWQTSGPVLSRPVPAGQVVAFGSHDGRLYVASRRQPSRRCCIGSPPAARSDAPAGDLRDRICCWSPRPTRTSTRVHLFSANIEWTYPSGASVLQKPLVSGDHRIRHERQGGPSARSTSGTGSPSTGPRPISRRPTWWQSARRGSP